MSTTLFCVSDVSKRYGLGRDLSKQLCMRLPHVVIGRRGRGNIIQVLQDDVEIMLARALEERRDLWQLVHDLTQAEFTAWLRSAPIPNRGEG